MIPKNDSTMKPSVVWYKKKRYHVILVQGNFYFIRRPENPMDSRWVHKDLVMELDDGT